MRIHPGVVFYATVIFILLSNTTSAQGIHIGKTGLSILDNSYDARLQMPHSIDPNFHCIKLSQDFWVWKNMVGQTFGLVKAKTKDLTISTTMSGYVELHDIVPQFMSWQLWRGNLGFSAYIEDKRINAQLTPRSRLVMQLGWYHESQHVTDMKTYAWEYLWQTDSFNNATARSFEYITLQTHYYYTSTNEKWTFLARPGYKYYPQPLLADAKRNLKNSYSVEFGLHRRLKTTLELYVHGFYESIQNDITSNGLEYKEKWDREPLRYMQVESGITFSVSKRQCGVFMRYNNSNGSGLDYLRTFKTLGGGFRFIL